MQERGTAPPLNRPVSRRRGNRRRLALTAGVAACVIAADQITKSWAVSRLSHGDIHVIWKLDFILEYNSGGAFSIAQGWAPVIGAAAIAIVCVLSVMASRSRSTGIAVSLGLVIGGALGNLCDRVFRSHHGAVIDFIALHFWPTFNVADSCVTIGGITLAILLWRSQSPSSSVSPRLPQTRSPDASSALTDAGDKAPD